MQDFFRVNQGSINHSIKINELGWSSIIFQLWSDGSGFALVLHPVQIGSGLEHFKSWFLFHIHRSTTWTDPSVSSVWVEAPCTKLWISVGDHRTQKDVLILLYLNSKVLIFPHFIYKVLVNQWVLFLGILFYTNCLLQMLTGISERCSKQCF